MAVAEKISELTALTAPAAGDLLCIVDVSDSTHSSDGTTKKITQTNYLGNVPVNIVQANALNIQTDKVRARDGDGLYLVDDGDNGIFVKDGGNVGIGTTDPQVLLQTAAGIVGINESANAKMTVGLTINQGANDDEILALKSSDVAHGITDEAETDTYGTIKKATGSAGGLAIKGYRDADAGAHSAVWFVGNLGEAAETAKNAVGYGVFRLTARVKDGTGVGAVGADGNLLSIGNSDAVKFIFDAEGEMHSDDIIGVGDDWDEWDDLALASDLSRLPKAKFNEMMKYKAEDFERAGLLTLSTDEDGNRHAFIRHKAMLQFAMCCFAEVAKRMKRYERALLELGVRPQLLEA